MKVAGLIMICLGTAMAWSVNKCTQESETKAWMAANPSVRFNETVAHAIHSFTMNDLIKFNPDVEDVNGIPVVNPRLNDPKTTQRVLENAPWEATGGGWSGETMSTIDMILSNIGQPTDGLGPNWSPLERVVHKFHMKDLWQQLKPVYDERLKFFRSLSNSKDSCIQSVCEALTDVRATGIFEAVDWVARHYKIGTPITLLNRPIPKLNDAKSWQIWKDRLLHYYDSEALDDAATFLVCALNKF